MSIISKISEILDERGITAAQMSRDLGFSSGLFSQWKRGKQESRKKSVEAIRDAGRIASHRAWPLLHPRLHPSGVLGEDLGECLAGFRRGSRYILAPVVVVDLDAVHLDL